MSCNTTWIASTNTQDRTNRNTVTGRTIGEETGVTCTNTVIRKYLKKRRLGKKSHKNKDTTRLNRCQSKSGIRQQDNNVADQPSVRDILHDSNKETASGHQGYVFIASMTFNHILTISFKHLYSLFFTIVPCILLLSNFFLSPTDAQENCFKKNY